MTAFKYNLDIDQGTTFSEKVVWKTGALKIPVDLTGCTANAQIREKIGSDSILLELSTVNGGIILGGITGEIEFYLPPIITNDISWKHGVYDMKIYFPNGKIIKKLYGSVTITQTVTQTLLY